MPFICLFLLPNLPPTFQNTVKEFKKPFKVSVGYFNNYFNCLHVFWLCAKSYEDYCCCSLNGVLNAMHIIAAAAN
jgi:hypothetical protein